MRVLFTILFLLFFYSLPAQGGFTINYLPLSVKTDATSNQSLTGMQNAALSFHYGGVEKVELSLFLRGYESEDGTFGVDLNYIVSLSKRWKLLMGLGVAVENPWDLGQEKETWTALVLVPQSQIRFFLSRSLFISGEFNYNFFLQSEFAHGPAAGVGIGYLYSGEIE